MPHSHPSPQHLTSLPHNTQPHSNPQPHIRSPVRLIPGPSALTLLASCDGSTLMRKGLLGISWGHRG